MFWHARLSPVSRILHFSRILNEYEALYSIFTKCSLIYTEDYMCKSDEKYITRRMFLQISRKADSVKMYIFFLHDLLKYNLLQLCDSVMWLSTDILHYRYKGKKRKYENKNTKIIYVVVLQYIWKKFVTHDPNIIIYTKYGIEYIHYQEFSRQDLLFIIFFKIIKYK